ncbi:spore protease YyaC [Paenibacillus antri]|uniref:Spore protease YyaC n=1 Tax=Paenibacillus antri TaxID=2582848 RepID=A0A5R9G2B8_9BACL|nr:spore protease YyaC [Paenibacillus antri]TLS49169.1 spore protease YyaC [Paenibacillus antri]
MERLYTVDGEGLKRELLDLRGKINGRPITFLCIGTDRSTGDALGPLVGTALSNAGYERVIGTLASPCDANTLPAWMTELAAVPAGAEAVVAIDAALGRPESVGRFQVTHVPMLPGASMGRNLPPVGDYGIAGIVNGNGIKSYAILQNTSLHRVMTMADTIVHAITAAFPR